MCAQLPTFDDIRARCVARHEDVRFETSTRSVSGERSTGVARAWDSEFLRAEIFCHRDGDAHAAGFETLRRI